ncbi:MAG TPA: hypothetical protein VF931_03475 [Steroidobacteraceae bacterium]
MRAAAAAVGLALGACGSPGAVADPPAAGAAADDRLVFSADGSTLSGGGGTGSGGSGTWLHYFSAGNVIGAGAEYQQIANAHWTAGTLSASLGLGQSPAKTHAYAEVHEGAGDIGTRAFHYSLVVAGVLGTLTPRFSVQVEERRIDIDTSYGNLPKVALSFRATPALSATASYAHSAGGNLGTRLTSLRLDYSAGSLSGMAGVVWGPAAPAVYDLFTLSLTPGASLTEGYFGIGKSMGRTTWLLVGDHQNVAGTSRTTISLTCALSLPAQGQLH